MERWQRFYFLVPKFNPVGGIVRDLCFAAHARDLGYEVVVGCKETYDPNLPIFGIPHVRELSPENGVTFVDVRDIAVRPGELAFFSGVGLYRFLERRFDRRTQAEQVIQAVRGPQLAEPWYAGGYSVKLLGRPMARIVTNEYVLEAVKSYLNPSSFTEIIPVGHDTTFFAKRREGGVGSPVKVGYTTWKSEVGDEVSSLLGSDSGFEFRAIRKTAYWEELRELYHWADVFLATTLPAEGFYLPGLEAMAAGALVLCPDVFGNRAYCRFGENCVLVGYEDAQSYAKALRNLASEGPSRLDAMRRRGYETASRHTWEGEEQQFGAFLEKLAVRLDQPGPSLPRAVGRASGTGAQESNDRLGPTTTNGTPQNLSRIPLASTRLERTNSKALAKRPFLAPGYKFRPLSTHDKEFHALRREYPYFGYVDVEVEGVPPFLMFSNNDDGVARTYFWYGSNAFESLSLRLWRELARRSSHIFDIGAFSGVYTLTAAHANRDAKVYCFEPIGQIHGRLVANLRVNELARRIEAFDIALSDVDGHAMINVFRGYRTLDSGASLFPRDGVQSVRREHVETTRLDTFVKKHALPGVDLVKIDVERAERMVIEGMEDSLRKHRPYLLVEVYSPEDLRNLSDRLSPFGYSFAVIDDVSQEIHVGDFGAHEIGSNVLFGPEPPASLRTFCDTVRPLRGTYRDERNRSLQRYHYTDRKASVQRLQQAHREIEKLRSRNANVRAQLAELEASRTFKVLKSLGALRSRLLGP